MGNMRTSGKKKLVLTDPSSGKIMMNKGGWEPDETGAVQIL